VVDGKNTGVIRVSFGACSTIEEVCSFVDFVREFYVEKESISLGITQPRTTATLQSIHICSLPHEAPKADFRSNKIVSLLFRSRGREMARNVPWASL
jgi:hypothetical protein